jgi:hypothetical protein
MHSDEYFCDRCSRMHSLNSNEGKDHFPSLEKGDPALFLEFVGTAGAWEFIRSGVPGLLEGTSQYSHDIQVFERLNEEFFKHQSMFASADQAQAYAQELDKQSFGDLPQYLKNKFLGAMGEIDHLRLRQDSLRYWLNSLTNGNQPMVDGTSFDLLKMKHQAFQTKASLATDPNQAGQLVRKFSEQVDAHPVVDVHGKEFVSKEIVLGANKEVLESPAAHNLVNPTEQVGTEAAHRETADRLFEKMQSGHANSSLFVTDTLTKIGQGALIGAALSISVSSFMAYRRYKRGEISADEALFFVGKQSVKGAVVGGSLSGLSLIIPGGVIGLGVGILVGISLRSVLDVAFGDGSYRNLVNSQQCVAISVQQAAVAGMILANVSAKDQETLRHARTLLRRGKLLNTHLDEAMDLLDKKRRKL